MISSLYISSLTYNELKEVCNCSDGNMATHTKKLLSEGFILTNKEFVNNKPQTTYSLTEKGREEFVNYIRPLIQAELTPIMTDGLPRHLYYTDIEKK